MGKTGKSGRPRVNHRRPLREQAAARGPSKARAGWLSPSPRTEGMRPKSSRTCCSPASTATNAASYTTQRDTIHVCRYYANFSHQAGSRTGPRRVVAFYDQRGTCEQWIKEGKDAIKWTRLTVPTPMPCMAASLRMPTPPWRRSSWSAFSVASGTGGLPRRFPSARARAAVEEKARAEGPDRSTG